LAANKRLNTAYLLKGSFGQLWEYEREGWARRFFDNWRASLKWQRLEPYEKFAEMIERHWDGIAAYCKPENKVSLGFVEGLNNKLASSSAARTACATRNTCDSRSSHACFPNSRMPQNHPLDFLKSQFNFGPYESLRRTQVRARFPCLSSRCMRRNIACDERCSQNVATLLDDAGLAQ
jgi:hypothetical protein